MATIAEAAALARQENGLAVVSTSRANGGIQSTLVNVAAMAHPDTGSEVLAFVAAGRVKLANMRARPQVSVTFKDGWRYMTVEGTATLAGPDDPRPWLDADGLRLLLRQVFTAAGGTHDDWDEYDRVMTQQRRTVVLVEPSRVYGS
jgi:PPOX class probable F420-dependent enzyme